MTNATLIEESDCSFDQSKTLTFQIILVMGAVFVSVSALISFYINKVDRKKLLSKKTRIFETYLLFLLIQFKMI